MQSNGCFIASDLTVRNSRPRKRINEAYCIFGYDLTLPSLRIWMNVYPSSRLSSSVCAAGDQGDSRHSEPAAERNVTKF
jgi:hypothetical protein